MKVFISLELICVAAGCAGHIETTKLESIPRKTNGVIYYAPTYVKVTYEYSALVDSNGRVVSDKGPCRRLIQKEEVQILPDFRHPYAVNLSGAFLNANKLQVSLSNGLLIGVNAESTPQQAALLTGLGAALQGAAAVRTTVQPPIEKLVKDYACNAAPVAARLTEIRITEAGTATQR